MVPALPHTRCASAAWTCAPSEERHPDDQMRQRCRRGVHRDHHVDRLGLQGHLVRHHGRGRHRSCYQTSPASGRGWGGMASWPGLAGDHRPGAQSHCGIHPALAPACRHQHPASHGHPGRDVRLGAVHPCLGPGVRLGAAYRRDRPARHVGVALGGLRRRRMGCSPREVRDRRASGRASPPASGLALHPAWPRASQQPMPGIAVQPA